MGLLTGSIQMPCQVDSLLQIISGQLVREREMRVVPKAAQGGEVLWGLWGLRKCTLAPVVPTLISDIAKYPRLAIR